MLERHTIPSVHGDFSEWHGGRPYYALWAIDVDVPAVGRAVAALAGHLAPYLLPGYRRQPHITLRLCGFPGPRPREEGDFTAADLAGHVGSLARAAVKPFEIVVGGPATFESAAYLAVADADGGIARLRRALAGGGPEEGRQPYVPHVTVGLYRAAFSLEKVFAAIGAVPPCAPLALAVKRLHLLAYESAVIGGPLVTLGSFDLGSSCWQATGYAQLFQGK